MIKQIYQYSEFLNRLFARVLHNMHNSTRTIHLTNNNEIFHLFARKKLIIFG